MIDPAADGIRAAQNDAALAKMNARASRYNLKIENYDGAFIARSIANSATTREGRVKFHYISLKDVDAHLAELEKAAR